MLDDFNDRGRPSREHRGATRDRLGRGKTVSLVQRRETEDLGRLVEPDESWFRYVVREPDTVGDAELRDSRVELSTLLLAQSTCDDQLVPRANRTVQLGVCD